MIDTKKMREVVQDKNYRNIWLNGSTHWDGCEYEHYPCAVLALCDELEKMRAEAATFRELHCTADDKMPPGNITDGFGHWWGSTCRKCGADMVIVRPGDARCSAECYLRDEERKERIDMDEEREYMSEIEQFHELADFVRVIGKPVQMSADSIISLDDEIQELISSKCEDCGVNIADYPSKICVGCSAYREHSGI